jgi:hypothetical protein
MMGVLTSSVVLVVCCVVPCLRCAVLCLQDVPAALNGLLDSLPSKVSIQGLPFDAVFTYALYTLNYVIVKVRPRLHQQFPRPHNTLPLCPCPFCFRNPAFVLWSSL